MQLPAYLLPAILATFSLAFAIVWWRGSKPAFWWMIAYAAQAVAYLGEIVPTIFHQSIDTMLVDTIFVAGFVGFGQATCLFFGWKQRVSLSLFLAVCVCAADAWEIFVAGSLKGELLAVDLGLASLALMPFLFNLRRLPPSAMDRAMLLVTTATVLNCVLVSTMFAMFGDANSSFETYMDSSYVAASYTVTSILNVVVPLVQLAAVALRVIEDHRRASEVDVLTGLLNRRGFERACSDVRRTHRGAVITCDIDRFKRINDEFGHASGDRVIQELGAAILTSTPAGSLAARFGGEEFVIFLPDALEHDAVACANEVSASFTNAVASRLPITFPVTTSFGVASVDRLTTTMHDGLKRADRALYAAKEAGRNRVVVGSIDNGQKVPGSDEGAGSILRAVA